MKDVAIEKPVFSCQFGGIVQVLATPLSDYMIGGIGVYSGPLKIMVTGSSAGGAAANATGVGVINPTGSSGLIRKDDKGYVPVFGVTVTGTPTSGVEIVTVSNCIQKFMKSD